MINSAVRDQILSLERDEIDDVRDEIVAFAEINSGTTNLDGTAAVQALLGDRLNEIGVAAEQRASNPGWRIDDQGERHDIAVGPIMRARFRPGAKTRLIIAGHADTVFGLDHPFQTVSRNGDLLRGPGVADMKGGLVAVVRAMAALERHSLVPDIGIDFIVNADEETGSAGSAEILEAAASDATSGIALVVEPRLPDGTFAGARPASANVAYVISGRGAHAGRALAEGRNAIVGAARLTLAASELTGQRPSLGVNVAAVHGGGPLNSVPDRCVIRPNLRCPSTDDLEWALAQLDAVSASLTSDHDLTVERHGGVHRPGKPWTDASRALSEVVNAGADSLGLPSGFTDTGGVCDGNNLTAKGLAVVDTLGVSGGGIHTSDEFTDLGTWPENVALLVNTIVAVADLAPTIGDSAPFTPTEEGTS